MSYKTSTSMSVAANDIVGSLKERSKLAAVYFDDIERSLVKATNRDVVVPKAKHVRNIELWIQNGSINIMDLTKMMQRRMKEGSWIVVFKTLILIHTLLSEDHYNRLTVYLGTHLAILNMTGFRDSASGNIGMEQSKNIKAYASFLEERILSFRDLDFDLFREMDLKDGKKMAKDWKLLSTQLPSIERMINRIVDGKFYLDSVNNEVTTESVRLIVKDLMKLFQALNEAITNMLKEFFTLGKKDAMQALEHYKRFCAITEKVKDYFGFAKHLQYSLPMTIPEIKHLPLSLTDSLKEYLDSPEFEQQRAKAAAGGSRDILAESQNSGKPKTEKDFIDVFANDSYSTPQPVVNQPPAVLDRSQSSLQQSNIGEMKALPPVKSVQNELMDLDFFGSSNQNAQPISTQQHVIPAALAQSPVPLTVLPTVNSQQQQLLQLQQLTATAYMNQSKMQAQQTLGTPSSFSGSFHDALLSSGRNISTPGSQQSNLGGISMMNGQQLMYPISPYMTANGAISQPMLPSQLSSHMMIPNQPVLGCKSSSNLPMNPMYPLASPAFAPQNINQQQLISQLQQNRSQQSAMFAAPNGDNSLL